ncbi:MAG: radical SAM family heme chaperone HemW [Clostridia bacterium]|nr:radical SAM family heme chaperone HemW [Clostridia bacterium]
MDEISLYIHIPFCNSKCYYCDFNSGKYSAEIQKKYFNSLKNEILQNKVKNKIKSIYFGGGTPSAADEKNIVEILNLIKNNFDVKNDAEITIECNPNSLDENKLTCFRDAGFNRLSLGVQTTNKKSLKTIGRIQEKNELKNYKKIIKNNLKFAKKLNFNISADLMLGLPKNNYFNLISDIFFLNKYCNHISVYMLTLYEGTKLFEQYKNESLENKIIKEYKLSQKLLKLLKFEQYEISNFAKAKSYSKHNLNYWACGQYLGFGLSAHSYLSNYRYFNVSSMQAYFNNYENINFGKEIKSYKEIIDQNLKLKNNVEKLTKRQQAEEYIMLNLRLKDGLNLTEFKQKFYDLKLIKQNEIKQLLNKKLIKFNGEKIVLTKKGILFENQVSVNLM